MGARIQIHQALFGYESGHHLLHTSLPLPADARQSLAIATDLSGSAGIDYEAAITGMPVPGTEHYALFCTWLAEEMPRPGCVWTHVLLVEFTDLAAISDLGQLRMLFRRPRSANSRGYSTPLTLTADNDLIPEPLPLSVEVCAPAILGALYGKPTLSVVVVEPRHVSLTSLVFSAWSQQWPRLRRNFRFSTGSLADRGRTGIAFDLQITPESNRRAWSSNTKLEMVDVENGVSIAEQAPWLTETVHDLTRPDHSNFRSFLRTSGADVAAPRMAFAKIAKVFAVIRQKEDWSLALATTGTEFAQPSEAIALKNFLFNPYGEFQTTTHLWEAFTFSFTQPSGGPFSLVAFELKSAIAHLWPARRDLLASFLVSPQTTDEHKWGELVEAVAHHVTPPELLWCWENKPELLAMLVYSNPALAADKVAWTLPERAQRRIISALERASVTPKQWREIILGLFSAGASPAAHEILSAAGDAAFDGVLDWILAEKPGHLPGGRWREMLVQQATRRLNETSLTPTALAFCIAILPARMVGPVSILRSDVVLLAGQPLEEMPAALHVPAAFFLVAKGLRADGALAAKLFSRAVFIVNGVLATDTEPGESWRLLEPLLPKLWPWDEWDHCEKLRRGLREWLSKNTDQAGIFARAASGAEERELARSIGDS